MSLSVIGPADTVSVITIHALPAREDRLRTRVAAEVRAWRGRLQISQTAMAKTLSLSQASISDRLNGKSAFTLDEIETLADAWGIDPLQLMGGGAAQAPIRPLTMDDGVSGFRCIPPSPQSNRRAHTSRAVSTERPNHLRAVS